MADAAPDALPTATPAPTTLQPVAAEQPPGLTIDQTRLKGLLDAPDVSPDVKKRAVELYRERAAALASAPVGAPSLTSGSLLDVALGKTGLSPESQGTVGDVARAAPETMAIAGTASLAPMAIPVPAGMGWAARVARGAAKAIAAGGAGGGTTLALRKLARPTQPLSDDDLRYAATQLVTSALPEVGAELMRPRILNSQARMHLLQGIETPAETLARASANRDAAMAALHETALGENALMPQETAQATTEAGLAGQAQALPSTIQGPTPVTSDVALGKKLQELARPQLEGPVEARKRALYSMETTLGTKVTAPTSTAGIVAPAQQVLSDLADQSRELGRVVDPKLTRRLKDIVASGTSEPVGGVPLFTSSEAKTPTSVGAKPAVPLKFGYDDWDELRQLLQPYVSKYERKPLKRSAEQGAIDNLMSDIRGTMATMRAGHPDLEAAAAKADTYYVHQVLPMRDTVNAITSERQPEKIAAMLTAPGAPGRLITAVQGLDKVAPAMATNIRVAGFEGLIDKARTPDGAFDPRAFAQAWKDLYPRQQAALAPANMRMAVHQLTDDLIATTDAKAALAGKRVAVDAKTADLARQIDQATSTMTSANKARLAEIDKSLGRMGMAAGVGAAMAHFLTGAGPAGMAELALGGAVGERMLARVLASPPSIKLLAKMNSSTNARFASRLGAQLVGTIVHEMMDSAVEGAPPVPPVSATPPSPATLPLAPPSTVPTLPPGPAAVPAGMAPTP